MSKKSTNQLGTLPKLSDAEKEAIAELVQTPGFKIWKKKIVPHREVQIALTNISMGQTTEDLWYNKGMVRENKKSLETLEKIAEDFNKGNIEEDGTDD